MGGFAMTFALNLVLNGVMSQLWNVFSTLQIITAMPLLSIVLPANVIFVFDIVDGVVNFSIIPKETIQEKIVSPIFGD